MTLSELRKRFPSASFMFLNVEKCPRLYEKVKAYKYKKYHYSNFGDPFDKEVLYITM